MADEESQVRTGARLFLWEDVEHVSDNWHPGGGLVVVGDSLEDAHELIRRHNHPKGGTTGGETIKLTEDELKEAVTFDLATPQPARVIVFPNSGCC